MEAAFECIRDTSTPTPNSPEPIEFMAEDEFSCISQFPVFSFPPADEEKLEREIQSLSELSESEALHFQLGEDTTYLPDFGLIFPPATCT